MIPISLKYFAEGEWSDKKTLAAWGLTNPRMAPRSRAVSTFTLQVAGGDPAAAPLIPYRAPVVIYGTLAGMNGGVETILFQGSRTDNPGTASPASRNTTLVISCPWWDMERTPFQHYWRMRSPEGELETVYFSRINLFQDITSGADDPWTYLDAQHQLEQIIDYAQTECGIAIQKGTIDPAWNLPVYHVTGVKCADALLTVLRTVPDSVTFYDYTTTPPTLHIRQRPNLTARTLPWAGTDAHGRAHKSSTIKSREDLQLAQVVFQYQQINNVDGQDYIYLINDAYPPDSAGNAVQAEVFAIDLRGGKINHLKATVTAAACDPTSVAFWKQHKPDLANGDIIFAGTPIIDTTINGGGGHPDGITIKDEAGANVTLASYPNELKPGGQVADWMSAEGDDIVCKEVTITAVLAYAKVIPGTSVNLQKIAKHPVSVRVKLTNSAAGSVDYSTVEHSEQGEGIPEDLAQNVYESLATLQYEGSHEILERDTYEIITPAFTLNLLGGNAAWETMAASIVSVELDFFNGRTAVTFGPHKHVTPSELFDLKMMWSIRRVYDNPALRHTGTNASGGTVQLPQDTAKENTNAGTPDQSTQTVHAPL